jgi:hypothetical protein
MNGLGYNKDLINNCMKYFWYLIALLVAISIYWILDWHDKHEDGE